MELNYMGSKISNELNNKINLFIYTTKISASEDDVTWETISDIVNDKFDIELTGNACRKRYYRFVEANSLSVEEDLVVTELQPKSDQDIIQMLREKFGIDDSYSARKIKTTATDDRTWYGAEWVREEVTEDKLELILDMMQKHIPEYKKFYPIQFPGENLLVPILFDAHIDKHSLIGGKTYIQVVDEIIETALGLNLSIDRVLLVIGNDFGNTDNVQSNTTSGTPQHNSVHWARSIDIRCNYAVHAIEKFSSIANTDVVMVHGNHDRYSNQWLGKVLEAWFRNNSRVSVDNTADSRKYYLWNKNMFGFVHGNEETDYLLPALMATESPKKWGSSMYREVFTGHFHRKRNAYYPLDEQHGMTVRWMPALSGLDDWHKLKGFVGNKRAALGIVYNPDGYKMEYSVSV